MKIKILPFKIILYFILVFLWSLFSWLFSTFYIKLSYEKSLSNLSSSLANILTKQIKIKMQDYFHLLESLNKIKSSSQNYEASLSSFSSLISMYPEIISVILAVDCDYVSYKDKNLLKNKTDFFFKKNFILRYKKSIPLTSLLSQEKFTIKPILNNKKIEYLEITRLLTEKASITGYFTLKVSLSFLEEILKETIESMLSPIYLNLYNSDYLQIIGNLPKEISHSFLEGLISLENKSYKKLSFNKKNYLSFKEKISFTNVNLPWYLLILLPFEETIPSFQSLLLFHTINGLILGFLSLLTIILILWSFKKNKEDRYKVKDFEEKADRDTLTGVYNRSKANKYLKCIQDNYNHKGISFCCILFDIDYFKKVNDSYGHDKGDYVLKKISSLIQMRIRSDDLLARVGGEEFLVILKNISIEDAYQKAEMLRNLIAQHDFDFSETSITISLGGAFIPQKDLYSPFLASTDALLEIADKALYFSKSHGRNQTTFTIINIHEFNYSLS